MADFVDRFLYTIDVLLVAGLMGARDNCMPENELPTIIDVIACHRRKITNFYLPFECKKKQ